MGHRKRIAIYGGTFDPVHLGHVEIAKRVATLFAIDEFLFVPACVAPHKLDRDVTSALHRYAMLALVTSNEERLRISTFELDEAGRRYTVDTLAHFRSSLGESTDLFFVMGADSWTEITTWRDWERLVTLARLIVVTRPAYEVSISHVPPRIASTVVDVRGKQSVETDEGSARIFITDAVMRDVSATGIRQAAREDNFQKLNKLVPPEVAQYIRKYRLYRNS